VSIIAVEDLLHYTICLYYFATKYLTLVVSFSALTLFVGLQKRHLVCKNLCRLPIEIFFSETIGAIKLGGNWLSQVHPQNSR